MPLILNCHCDSSLFVKKTAASITILLIYVNDVLLTGNDPSYLATLQKYASELLAKAGMADCKPYSSPMAFKPTSSSHNNDLPFSNPSLYRSIVGGLQYLTITRPDLAFAVNFACQYMHQPLVRHFVMVKRLLRYLKGTLGYGLQFSLGPLTLHAFSDSNWAGDSLDKRSTIGFCIFLGPNLVS
ncbi:uncharacterized protein LOC114305326 [Camellia sinensis]|uniref:uncharacterized protein LOC114305326 n=1 Tax=Camellia sinensis TaxID=4442 RepID=UPI001035A8F0|nr:uncharacterized protein LOC114305326 [Camellia sinensis]